MSRTATIHRKTRETEIAVTLSLDGVGAVTVSTGVGFLDHLLTALATHAGFDLSLTCTGDLHVDDHHTAEDCAIAIGQAIDAALGDRTGIARFGSAYAPLDEALARGVVDLVTRAHATVNLPLNYDRIGGLACENIPHVLASLATAARLCLHADLIRGENDHHKAEATFKAAALALRQAVTRTGAAGAPSTKGVM
ncbi:MAG: imidazoleglycerol-phosphate dehydratase HisB [Leptolyngbya sp. PLA2]|nr:imidazoleglycerol-phosphate dehydratase HisB [Leptolyngbya sp.]MCE7970991.1 imidazoleglycerol-phosphate dehydratase HisB [Leptolyngbya sp. PL-A2]MCZ7631938.1 imidazoleglycerol-phosphate dehydratase HisB [Phycisphaerales bacterium]MDL1905302.1 imidazoleglycerol-phosphate dehydratase HisB [Synechococcales cyanobacterium CNB]GIK20257.1 MAG: imidazoleglycerol-phosphate dehydratase [Planctomycetota bacterium]